MRHLCCPRNGKRTVGHALRLRGPEGDLVDQDLVRSTAAHAVLLDRLDRLAVEKALGVLAEPLRQGHENYLFLGLSGLTATDANFATWLSARLRARQLVGTGLVLEFRLPEISDHMSSARTVIGALKDMGIAVGLSRFPDKPVAVKVLRFLQADYVRLADALAGADLGPVEAVVKEVHGAGAQVIVDNGFFVLFSCFYFLVYECRKTILLYRLKRSIFHE